MSIAVQQLKKAKVALLANPAYVDTTTSGNGEAHNLAEALKGLGHKVRTFTDISAAGLAKALDGRDVLVLPELEKAALPLSADALAVLRDFVGHGGTLIVGGDTAMRATSLLNSAFGLAIYPNLDLSAGEALSRIASPPATHVTTFPGDPATIPANDRTQMVWASDLPANALNVYGFGSGSAVSAIPFGAGQIVYLGWDWWEGTPVGALNGGWLEVLQSAVSRSDGKIVGTAGPDSFAAHVTNPGQAFPSEYRAVILGKGGDDFADGAGGNDVVKGGGGKDTIFGGDGRDKLYGGGGDDYIGDYGNGAKMWGGGGADTFALSLPGTAGVARIMDFKHGTDVLVFDLNHFAALTDGPLSPSAFRKGSKATTADHRLIYDKSGKLFYDPDGDGPARKILVAKLDGHPKLTPGDIDVGPFG